MWLKKINMFKFHNTKFWDSSRIVIFSFLGIILIGTFLLMLPQSAQHGSVSFINALFTATSATCVTGLTVVDTGTVYSFFGQLVILCLIQAGGLGIMTFSTFFIFLVIGRFSISERDVIQETMTQAPMRNIASLLRTIFISTIIIELIGALLLAGCFLNRLSPSQACYYGIFHSVSAFCNAGFGLFPNNFVDYQSDWKINLILMMLIISGGIGFIVLHEFRRYLLVRSKSLKKSFSFHSKLAILITAILISGGALILFFFEMNNVLRHLPASGKILVPLFQSVTSRTAGFNTVDIGQLTDSSLFFLVILMFIGASPGSCGGGIKTTTAGIVIAMLAARFQNRDDVNIGHHRILNDTISKAISVTFFSIVIITMFTIILMVVEKGWVSHQLTRGIFLESLFEVVSAFGTVGLSTGITSGLSSLGKLLIVIVMFIGRVGPLTVVLAIARKEVPKFRYAPEKVLIG